MNLEDSKFLADLGYRIREQRLACKWTQADLAAKCQLHRTFIGSVERGERNLSMINLRRIAKALRVSPAALLGNAR